jgi:lipopolysaccharide/colanic/teichoic acid biosynthesis glycosyltransferase
MKRVVDLFVAGLAIVVTSPVLLAGAVAVRWTMGRPILFRDRRSGRGGRPFNLLKFRTMRPLEPGETIPDADAARITPVGRVLRVTSIDELPSLLNVFAGDMSLVGPRPLPVRYTPRYTERQARRLGVKPGITGWAQVNGRNAVSWDEKLELDVWYVDHRSLRLDLQIMAKTAAVLLRREGIGHEGHATMPEFSSEAASPVHADTQS